MAIIQNGSPLFSGDAGSGPSNIRQYILENDWLDAIVQLSTDQFMNTGIATYIWVLAKDRPSYRAGKVQLIDASHCFEPRRKSIGKKRNDITDYCRKLVVKAYGEFTEGIFGDKNGIYCESKIFDSVEFGYNKIVVERPLLDENGKPVLKKGKRGLMLLSEIPRMYLLRRILTPTLQERFCPTPPMLGLTRARPRSDMNFL